jgi:hypothetical protein
MSTTNQWLAAIILLRGPFMISAVLYFVIDVHKSTLHLSNNGPALVFAPLFFVVEIFVAAFISDVLIDSYTQFDDFTNKRSMSVSTNVEYHAPTKEAESVESRPRAIASRTMTKEVPHPWERPIDDGHSSSSDTPVTPGTVTPSSVTDKTTESGKVLKSKDMLGSDKTCGSAGKWGS